MKTSRLASILFVVIAITFILSYLQEVIIPFVLAVIIWSLIRSFRTYAKGLTTLDDWMPNWLSGSLSFVLVIGVLGFVANLLVENIKGINEVLPAYQDTLNGLRTQVLSKFGIDLNAQLNQYLVEFDFTKMLGQVLNSLSSVLGNVFLIVIYLLFLMLEEQHFPRKIVRIFGSSEKRDAAMGILNQIDKSLSRYVGLKTFVSLLTGILSYVVLSVIGVDFAFFWAFLIFVLNYIPNIGSLIGTLFPALVAALEFGDWQHPLGVLLGVGAIQLVVGNLIEPRVMGNSLNVSALVVILSLVFWGFLWGIIGMILSVPIMVMLVIVLSQYPKTRFLAILLSEQGRLPNEIEAE